MVSDVSRESQVGDNPFLVPADLLHTFGGPLLGAAGGFRQNRSTGFANGAMLPIHLLLRMALLQLTHLKNRSRKRKRRFSTPVSRTKARSKLEGLDTKIQSGQGRSIIIKKRLLSIPYLGARDPRRLPPLQQKRYVDGRCAQKKTAA